MSALTSARIAVDADELERTVAFPRFGFTP
jgi:hypothetical protein